jgi:WD40 repeat protein
MFSPDGQILAVRDEIGIRSLHEATSGKELVSKRVGVNKSLGFWGGPRRRTLFAYSYHAGLIPLDPDRKKSLPVLDGSTELIEPAFSPDGTRAVSKLKGFHSSTLTGHTLSPKGVQKAWVRRPTDPAGKLSGLQPLCFLPDGDRFLVAVYEVNGAHRPRLMICRWSDKADRVSCEAPRGFTVGRLSPDGSRLACPCHEFGAILVYDTGDLTRPPDGYTVPGKQRLGMMAYHPSGEFLAAVGGNDVILLDACTFRVMRSYDWQVGPVQDVAFSPDGALAAVSGETGKVVVWDVDV